jgi:hypothetical protein
MIWFLSQVLRRAVFLAAAGLRFAAGGAACFFFGFGTAGALGLEPFGGL